MKNQDNEHLRGVPKKSWDYFKSKPACVSFKNIKPGIVHALLDSSQEKWDGEENKEDFELLGIFFLVLKIRLLTISTFKTDSIDKGTFFWSYFNGIQQQF